MLQRWDLPPGLRFLCPTPLQDPTVRLTETQATCSDPQENSCADKQGKIIFNSVSKAYIQIFDVQIQNSKKSRTLTLGACPYLLVPSGIRQPRPLETAGPCRRPSNWPRSWPRWTARTMACTTGSPSRCAVGAARDRWGDRGR